MYFLGLIQHKGQYRDNIAVYKRIGMTKSEIRQIFLMEAVYFNGIGILLALFFSHFILAVPLDFYTIFFSLGIWLFLSIIYILPTLPSMNEKGENLWKSF